MAQNILALAERLLHRHLHRVQLHLLLLVLFANAILLPVQSFSVDTTAAAGKSVDSKKLLLFPYQEKGVDRLCSDRRLILGDDMGLGKTCQAISALNRLYDTGEFRPDQGRVLIICPKSVLNVWVDELEQWLDPRLLEEMDIHVCTAGEEPSASDRGLMQLINYDICHKHKDLLQGQSWDVVICDEAHYLKSHSSKRTLAILGSSTAKSKAGGVTQSASYVWLLTGTPILNRPVELYPLLRALDSSEWGSRKDFIESYCEPKSMKLRGRGRYVTNNNGASNLQELKKRLQPYMLRRYKVDVLTDLPPKLRSCVNLDGSDAAVQERRMVAEMMGMDDYVVERYDDADADADEEDEERNTGKFAESDSLVSFSAEASALTHYGIKASDFEDDKFLGALAKIRKETAMLKIKPAVALLKDVMACEKVVVFAHHRAIIYALVEEFGSKCVHIIGGMDTESRALAVRRFQNDDGCRIFIGSIRAAGVGVTLTAASHVVFLELDWSPAIMAQAEDRCHRVGQQDSVLCQYYVFRDTIDEWIAKTIIKKDVVATMALPTDRDTIEKTVGLADDESEGSNAYVFDFGKHKGIRIEDVPESYLMWLVTNESIWKKRPELWRALAYSGLVRDEPPPLDAGREAKRPTYVESNDALPKPTGKVDYVFNFGKHRSEQWEDVPISYRDWVVKNDVWKNRPDLKEALQSAGVIEVD